MACLSSVLVLVLLFCIQADCLQVVAKDGSSEEQKYRDANLHDIQVECPKDCSDKIHFELNCSSGAVSSSRQTDEYVATLEKKVSILERMLMPSDAEQAQLVGGRNIAAKILDLEVKVDRIVQCLNKH